MNDKWEFSGAGKPLAVAVEGGLTLDNDFMMASAAKAGAGLAFVIKGLVQQQLDSRERGEVLADYGAPAEGFWLSYPSRKYQSTPLRCFIEWLQQFNRAER